MNSTKEWLEKSCQFAIVSWKNFIIRPWCICNDGFELSIQASGLHNSEDGIYGYTSVELLIPREIKCTCKSRGQKLYEVPHMNLLKKYHVKKETSDYARDYYDFVPLYIVNYILSSHGGINYDESKRRAYESKRKKI